MREGGRDKKRSIKRSVPADITLKEYLIEAGHEAQGISRNADGNTPLMTAVAREANDGVVRLLIDRFERSISWRNKAALDAVIATLFSSFIGKSTCFYFSCSHPLPALYHPCPTTHILFFFSTVNPLFYDPLRETAKGSSFNPKPRHPSVLPTSKNET